MMDRTAQINKLIEESRESSYKAALQRGEYEVKMAQTNAVCSLVADMMAEHTRALFYSALRNNTAD